MRSILLAIALLAGACAPMAQQGAEPAGGEVARQLRVAAAAERGGQFDVAMQIYANLAAADPAGPEVAARRATLLTQLGDPDAALDALAPARRRHPDHAGALQAEGRALLELGRAPEALALYETRLRAVPNDPAALNGKAVALDLLGRHAEAHAAYRAARAADPRNPLLVGNYALSLVLAGCPDQAVAVLEGAPRNADTQAWLGEIRSLARNLAGSGGAAPAELRAALPASGQGCPAA